MADSDATTAATLPSAWNLRDWAVPLTGVGQIMFQNSPVTGAFFLIGIAVASPVVAAGGAIGSVLGSATASFLRFPRDEIRDGLYGFNSSLVGMALLAIHQPVFLNYVLVLVGSILAALVTYSMRRRMPLPSYTAPFIVTTWVALFLAGKLAVPTVIAATPAADAGFSFPAAVVRGISEVMFEGNILTGMLFLVGIVLCSWKDAVWAVIGSVVGLLTAISHHDPELNLALGIYGYNASLAAIALALYRPSLLLPMIGAFLSVILTESMPRVGLPTLTAPFVLATWMTMLLDKLDQQLTVADRRSKTGEGD